MASGLCFSRHRCGDDCSPDGGAGVRGYSAANCFGGCLRVDGDGGEQCARQQYRIASDQSPPRGLSHERATIADVARALAYLVIADLDLDVIRQVRNTWQFFRDRRPETYTGIVKL